MLQLHRKRKSASLNFLLAEEVAAVRVLIADKFPVVRSGLRHVIEANPGWIVAAEVENGFEAVRTAVKIRPNVAILGHPLPRLDGIN